MTPGSNKDQIERSWGFCRHGTWLKKLACWPPKETGGTFFFRDSPKGGVGTSPSAVPLVEGWCVALAITCRSAEPFGTKVEEAWIRSFGSADALNAKTAVDLGAGPGGLELATGPTGHSCAGGGPRQDGPPAAGRIPGAACLR